MPIDVIDPRQRKPYIPPIGPASPLGFAVAGQFPGESPDYMLGQGPVQYRPPGVSDKLDLMLNYGVPPIPSRLIEAMKRSNENTSY